MRYEQVRYTNSKLWDLRLKQPSSRGIRPDSAAYPIHSPPQKTHIRRLLEDVEFVSRFSFGNDLVVFLKILHLQSIRQLGAFIGVHGGKQRHLRAENVGSYGII